MVFREKQRTGLSFFTNHSMNPFHRGKRNRSSVPGSSPQCKVGVEKQPKAGLLGFERPAQSSERPPRKEAIDHLLHGFSFFVSTQVETRSSLTENGGFFPARSLVGNSSPVCGNGSYHSTQRKRTTVITTPYPSSFEDCVSGSEIGSKRQGAQSVRRKKQKQVARDGIPAGPSKRRLLFNLFVISGTLCVRGHLPRLSLTILLLIT